MMDEHGPVVITKEGTAQYVLMDFKEYECKIYGIQTSKTVEP